MSDKWIVHDFDQAPERSPRLPGRGPLQVKRTDRERRSLHGALLVSVLLHVLLLSQLVGGDGQGLAGFVLPWQERRIAVPDVQVVLAPLPATPLAEPADPASAVPVQRASIRSLPVDVPTPKPLAPPVPRPRDRVVVDVPAPKPAAPVESVRTTVADAAPVNVPPRADVPDRAPPPPPPLSPRPSPEPTVLTAEPVETPTPVVPAAPPAPAVPIAVAPSASSPDPAALAAREAVLEAQRQDAARAELARLEAERREAARLAAAAQQEAQRQEAARQSTARAEAVRLEAERQEAARQAAAQLAQQEAQRQEAARQATARAEAARLEAERQEAARRAAALVDAQRQEAARQAAVRAEATRLEAERQEAARKAVAQQEAARIQAVQDAAAKREAVLRAIGRQLDEENARRDAAANAARSPNALPLSLSTARRVRLWGHTNPNADLVAYAQAWASKIQLNTLPDKVREVAKRPHTPATVTVAVRSDGSVESVTVEVSSGVADIDDAIRRIIDTQRPYPVFPPALAREFDVVEIRRTWYFDAAVRLH
ncbi:TonB C-terminal domain-containing protein [Sphaerotilus sp.]|uniref:TonB C-terminal domain-containing protein n=1 Tax=Sphaerotilus sp. TaxID=2093942 RepID=UPI00286DA2D1|nr:TonB C-terminal domain-containing protein [Sphaerotilus sp.]